MELEANARVTSPWLTWPAVLGVLGGMTMVPLLELAPYLLVPSLVSVGVAVACGIQLGRRPKKKIVVTQEALTIGDRRIARASFTSGIVTPSQRGGYTVRLTGRRSVDIDTPDPAVAARILETLQLDAEHHAAIFSAVAPARSLTGAAQIGSFIAFMVLFGVGLVFWKPLAVLACVLGLLPALLAPSRVEVGTDGIFVKNRLDQRFHRYDDIQRIELFDRGITLVTKKGTFKIPLTAYLWLQPVEKQQREALLARIREAMSARAADPRAAVETLLDRGERSVTDWLAHLARPLDGDEGFRSAALRVDDLRAVLEGSTSRWKRLAAALLLARDESQKTHVRVAADACADPKLRVALEVVADGRDVEAAALELEEDVRREATS